MYLDFSVKASEVKGKSQLGGKRKPRMLSVSIIEFMICLDSLRLQLRIGDYLVRRKTIEEYQLSKIFGKYMGGEDWDSFWIWSRIP